MNDAKYIGLYVHQATISVAVRDSAGKLVTEAILETKAETILRSAPRDGVVPPGHRCPKAAPCSLHIWDMFHWS
jgi:hypothetical protein